MRDQRLAQFPDLRLLNREAAHAIGCRSPDNSGQAVLRTCLQVVQDEAVRAWAYRHLAAVGYSSARPVMADGAEDKDRSRRVVFSIDVDDAGLLQDVERDLQGGRPGALEGALNDDPALASGDVLSGTVTHVRDGDTIEVAGHAVRLKGVTCDEESSSLGARAAHFVEDRVLGKQMTCALSGEASYDRLVGSCSADGADLGATLIEQGVCGRCVAHDSENLYAAAQSQAGEWLGDVPPYCG